jgi:hypothetical protein
MNRSTGKLQVFTAFALGHRATRASVLIAVVFVTALAYLLCIQAAQLRQDKATLTQMNKQLIQAASVVKTLEAERQSLAANAAGDEAMSAAHQKAKILSSLNSPWQSRLALFETPWPDGLALLELSLDLKAQTAQVKVEGKNTAALNRFANQLALTEQIASHRTMALGINEKHPMKPAQMQFELLFKPVAAR